MQMVKRAKPGSTLILNSDVGVTSDPAANILTFGDGGAGGDGVDVRFEEIDHEHAVATAMNRRIEFAVKDYDIFSYRTAILGAVSAAISMNTDLDCIKSFLDGFSGVSGRMKIMEVAGRTVVDNSNSGMNISSAESAIDHASESVCPCSETLSARRHRPDPRSSRISSQRVPCCMEVCFRVRVPVYLCS
jgi:UDP-N-acetylmuramyl pentapeptide synthase